MHDAADKSIRLDNGVTVELPFRARAIRRAGNLVLVLLDPDDYLSDDTYKADRHSGAAALKNLMAFDDLGHQVWQAELPESLDYYYAIEPGMPIRALSYSGLRCVIDERDGRIQAREFLK